MYRSLAITFLSTTIWIQFSLGQTSDIVKQLLPDGNPLELNMPNPSEKDTAIQQLKEARASAPGKDVQQIAFLLALLKADYESNRDYLLWVLKGCDTPKIVHGCDDMTPVYLISLYEHGHPEILPSLFRSSLQNYNASGSEALGGLLSDLVVKSPNIFLDNLKSFPVSEQKEICYSAGLADGGGMAPENLKNLEKRLDVLNDEMADTCIRQIEKANKPGINDNDE